MQCLVLASLLLTSEPLEGARPVRTEVVAPLRSASFNKAGRAKKRIQGGNPRQVEGLLLFDGSQDGNRQVDPQIAVGGGYVLHGTNNGLVIYTKGGKYVDGVPQTEFNHGIDPKLFFDSHNRVFGFDMWKYWDQEKIKPVNISISATSDPTGAWSTYPVSASKGVDGGAIGYSRRWVGYSFPGGEECTFVGRMADMKAGRPATIYHFAGSLGHPVFTQDPMDDLYFVALDDANITLTRVGDAGDGSPVVKSVVTAPHGFPYFGWPPAAPMKGTDAKVSSGDRNPKGLVIQNGHLWFSQAVDIDGRAGVQWNEFDLQGRKIQSGILSSRTNSYIQTTLGVNRRGDVLVGFQESGPSMFVSPRCAWRMAGDRPGTLRKIVRLGEGLAANEGGAWGDYSGTTVDGDNGRDLWTIQSVANEQGRGATVIVRVKM